MLPGDNKDKLFGIDLDIDTSINIEVKHQISSTVINPKINILFYIRE